MDFLNEVENKLDLASAEKEPVMRELKSHYYDLRDELKASGMEASQAEQEAAKRMGDPADIAARLSATHNTATWKPAILCALPFVLSAIYLSISLSKKSSLLFSILISIIGVVMTIGSLRELVRGRRPIWLSTWLAAAISIVLLPLKPVILYGTDHIVIDSTIIGIIVLAVIVIILASRSKIWQWVSVLSGSLSLLITIYMLHIGLPQNISPILPLSLVLLFCIQLMLFARYIFELHSYGNGAKASLFLLALIVLKFQSSYGFVAITLSIITEIAISCLVIWFARSSRNLNKERALLDAVFVWALAAAITSIPGNSSLIGWLISFTIDTIVYFGVISTLTLIPISAQIKRNPQNSQPSRGPLGYQ